MLNCLTRLIVVVHLMAAATITVARSEEKPPSPPPPRDNKIRVLIVTGGHGFERDDFFEMFAGHPDIIWKEVIHPEATKWFAPDKANQYDVMVWYDFITKSIPQADRNNLVALLKRGKPLVALHHCLADYQDWPEAEKILGGKFLMKPEGDHPRSTFKHDMTMLVKIADPQHPITRFMDDFQLVDEVYGQMRIDPGVKPLLTTDHPQSNKVIGWTHTYGNSPVVYLQSGHGPTAYSDPNYRRLVTQAFRWAADRLPDPSEKGFIPLFNGKNLDGWKSMGSPNLFRVNNGILRSDLSTVSGHEWMRTDKLYSDFVLRLEWRVSQAGNAGVFIRSKDKQAGYPWITGSEIQITNAPRDIAHCTGSLYGTVSVDPRPDESADTWHEFEIQCRGPHYKVFVDNIPVVDLDSRRLSELYAKPLIGYIGLQGNHSKGGWIEYRNIRIKELKMTTGKTSAWRLGIQAWTFHLFSLFETIDKTAKLGLNCLEAYPGQPLSLDEPDVKFIHGVPSEVLDKVKHKLADAGVALVNYGVVKPTADEAETRILFEFARLMGIETITAEPDHDAFDVLDRLTQEYGINIAIHNHPRQVLKPAYVYWNQDEVRKMIDGRSPRIGVCADTGHWPRSGLNPVEALRNLKGRIIAVHFKDLNQIDPKAHDVPWGTGLCDVKAMLTELHQQRFSGMFSIEYEHNWEDSMREIAQSIEYFRQVARSLGY